MHWFSHNFSHRAAHPGSAKATEILVHPRRVIWNIFSYMFWDEDMAKQLPCQGGL